MIRIDRKIANAIKKLNPEEYESLEYDEYARALVLFNVEGVAVKSCSLPYAPRDAKEAINRLISAGYLKITSKHFGGFQFTTTSRLRHEFQFWLDAVTRDFWHGFFAGAISALAAAVIGALISYAAGIWQLK